MIRLWLKKWGIVTFIIVIWTVVIVKLLSAQVYLPDGSYQFPADFWACDSCPPGYVCCEKYESGQARMACCPDPAYWYWQQPYVTLSDVTGEDSCFVEINTGGWQRIDSMWVSDTIQVCDTVPEWREVRLLPAWDFDDTLKVWPRWQSGGTLFGDTIQNFLVQVGRIECRDSVAWRTK